MDALFLTNLLNWSLQAAALTIVGASLLRFLRVEAPVLRYAYWRALLVVVLALPVLQPRQVSDAIPLDLNVVASSTPQPAQPGAARGAVDSPATGLRRFAPGNAMEWIALLLAAGVVARLAWLVIGVIRLQRLRRSGEPAAPAGDYNELVALIEAGAQLRCVPGLRQPVTFGLFKPIVMLPDMFHTLPETVQRAVLAHELWHVRRGDWGWLLIEEIIRAALWFNPAISWLVTRVQASREEVVDELTVQLTNARRTYLEALLVYADEPVVFPAAPFARRRHLFQRMLLISREAVMSSRRIVASGALAVGIVALSCWSVTFAFPLKSPAEPAPPTPRAAAAPSPDATMPRQVRDGQPGGVNAGNERERQIEAKMQRLEVQRLLLQASLALEKASNEQAYSEADRLRNIEAGLAAANRALGLSPGHVDALRHKSAFLRMQAERETDPAAKSALTAQATALSDRLAVMDQSSHIMSFAPKPQGDMPPPPPPAPLPLEPMVPASGVEPVKVGGAIAPPMKLKDVKPIYPPIAQQAGVQGVVILQVLLDEEGRIEQARVVKSQALLDQAALDAVVQWRFKPVHVNNVPVPAVMTLSVNFVLQ